MQVLTSIRDDLIKIGIGSYGLNAGNGIDLTAYQQAVELSKTNDVTIYTFGKTLPDIPNVDIRIVPEYRKPWKTQGLAKELKGYDFFISYGHPFFLLAPKLDNHVMVDFGTPALRYASSKKEAFFWSIIKAETAYAVRYSRLVLPGSKYIARSTQCWNANSFVNHSGIQFGNSAYPPIKLSSRGDPYVLYVGRHTPYKNVHTLIQIFRRVQKEVPNAHYFYAGNTGGAVAGCLLAGFYLLRVHSMPTATYAAVVINVIVALIALATAAKIPWKPETPEKTEKPLETGIGAAGVYITIGLSGLSALGAEVIWTRLLSLMLGVTVYTFSIIMAVFLTGLGIGSSGGAFLYRKVRSARASLGICQILIAMAAAWAAFMINSIPYWPINPIALTAQYGPWYMFLIDLLKAACAVLPGAIRNETGIVT